MAEKKHRDSNIVLFRIIMMLLIIAHHYVVNSGLMDEIAKTSFGLKPIVLLIFGAWGKIGINGFVLITGYFMCKSQTSARKFLRLVLEVVFYKCLIYLGFVVTGYDDFGWGRLLKAVLPVTSVADNFTGCFLIFYLLIPFCNILGRALDRKKHLLMLIVLLSTYSVLGNIPIIFTVRFNYVTWFVIIFFIGAYLRCYEPKLVFSHAGWKLACLLVLDILSVTLMRKLGFGKYYFLNDSNKILAVLTAVYGFAFFKQLKIGYHMWINTIAASTFGVLQIHANSDTMRNWLWRETLGNTTAYYQPWWFAHAVFSVLAVFIICTGIDWVRIRLLERPFFAFYDRHEETVKKKLSEKIDKIYSKLIQ